ncbi:MAG: glycosyltransferase [Terracidiphilus sp.]
MEKALVERKRVLLLIPHLGGGGAEHVMTLLAQGLKREKYEVHLGLVQQGEAAEGAVGPQVTIHALGTRRARAGAYPLLRLVWCLRPEVIVSGAVEVSFLALLLRPFFPPKTCLLVRQNATVSSTIASGELPRWSRLLYRALFRRSDRVICQSVAMARDLTQAIGIAEEQIAVLPNPVDVEAIRAAQNGPSVWSGAGPHLLAMGRLSREKGFDLLLEAMVAVRERFADADLILAGAGREAAALKLLCGELGLENAVRFAGRVENPYALFPGATLFVLSSRHEGMPNALLEAAAAGLPLVATPASGGVVDLLRDRRGAWLVPEISAEALGETLIAALEAIRPGERIVQPFFSALKPEPVQSRARNESVPERPNQPLPDRNPS